MQNSSQAGISAGPAPASSPGHPGKAVPHNPRFRILVLTA